MEHTCDTIREALHFIPAHDRELWLRIGMAIKSELSDAGFKLWDEWSRTTDNYDPKAARTTWRSITPDGGVIIGTLYHEAQQHGFRFNGETRPQPPTAEEIAERDRREQENEGARQRAQEDAAKNAERILEAATGAPATHPYAVKKRVPLGSLVKRGPWPQRGWDDALLVPIYGVDGRVWSIEAINADGGKDSLKHGKKRGGFHPFGKVRSASRVFIAEGVANAAVGAEVDKSPAAAAMGKSNLPHVAMAVRELAPDAELIILADNDLKLPKEAHEAAAAIGGRVAIPELDGRKCDLWNLWDERGAEAVRACIADATEPGQDPDRQEELDIQATIARLAALSPIEYDRARQAEADQLGARVSTLDAEVKRARATTSKQSEKPEHMNTVKPERPALEEDPLVLIDEAIEGLGYGGDRKLPNLLYLCCTSRLLSFSAGNMLAHGQVVGPPSGGKNFAVDTVLFLLPEGSYLKIDAGSPKALIYSGEDLQHRIVVFTEADSLPISEGKSLADGDSRSTAASALRNLASDGYLSYDIVERDPQTNQFTTRKIRKDGPTLLLTTTTKAIGGQMGTRLWEIPVKETDAQIRAALSARVSCELTRQQAIRGDLSRYQEYLQSEAPWEVVVPFAKELADGLTYTGMNPRILRDFQRILSLIKSAAILRHPSRERNSEDRLIATLEDYDTVRAALNDSYMATVSEGLTEDVNAAVDAVKVLHGAGALVVTYSDVARHLSWNVMKASRKARIAMRHGWLVNRQEKPRHPANLDLGANMPESRGLPTKESLVAISSGIPPRNDCYRVNPSSGAGFGLTGEDNSQKHTDNDVNSVNNPVVNAKSNENNALTGSQPFRGGVSGAIAGAAVTRENSRVGPAMNGDDGDVFPTQSSAGGGARTVRGFIE